MVKFFSQEQSGGICLEETQSNNLGRISYGTDRLVEGNGRTSYFDCDICTAIIGDGPNPFGNFALASIEHNIGCTTLSGDFQALIKPVNANHLSARFPGELSYDLA